MTSSGTQTKESKFRSGYVSIAGKPNVGKSTLLNQILGEKIAIVTPKPNTTRNRILGVKNLENAQIIFIDTPGIHFAKKELNKYMVAEAIKSLKEADLVFMMIEANSPWQEEDLLCLKRVKELSSSSFLLINKIDLVSKPEILTIIDESQKLYPFKEIVPICAKTGDGVDLLLKLAEPYLPEGPPYFPEEMLTDRAERFIVAEQVREKLFYFLQEEVPYSVAVVVESWEESEKLIRIRCVIYVERESQKAIVIGKAGSMLKKVGTSARKEIESFLGKRVFLELYVKLSSNWTRDKKRLKELGYG